MNRTDPDRTEAQIDEILDAEGRVFSDNPDDRGGPTHFGITLETLTAWRMARYGTVPRVEDLKSMKEAEARDIYRERYIRAPGFDLIEDHLLRANVIDAGVLHGTGWASRRLQEVAGVKVDGIVGPVTLGAVNRHADSPAADIRFTCRRVEKCVRIAKRDPSQLKWLGGWTNRAMKFLLDEAELLDAL